MVVATVGLAPCLIAPLVILGFGLDTMFAALAGVCLLLAVLIALGFRWAPALALLPGLGLPAMLVPFLLTHRGSPLFLTGLLLLGRGAIASGEALRSPADSLPRRATLTAGHRIR